MDIAYLRHFYEVARHKSFSAAGKYLQISQSALSKTVALLEEREGVTLLHRSSRGVKLTEVGEDIFGMCKELFEHANQIERRLKGAKENIEGPIRFGCSDHLAKYILASKVTNFFKKHPLTIPSLFIGAPHDIITRIQTEELEFGLFFTRLQAPQIEYRRISPFEYILVTSDGDDLKDKKMKVKEGIVGSISKDYERHPSYRISEYTHEAFKINIEANSQDLQKILCLNGGGAALLAKFMVKDELKNKQLFQIKLDRPIYYDLLLAKRKNHRLSRSAEAFIKDVVDKLKDA